MELKFCFSFKLFAPKYFTKIQFHATMLQEKAYFCEYFNNR